MKLAEALVLRADLQKRMAQLKQRALANARVQEGEQPAENPATLVAEFNGLAAQLSRLVDQVNRTNLATEVSPGVSITRALAQRDELAQRRGILVELATTAVVRQDRFMRSELRAISTVDVGALQRQADDLARQFRELDTQIQAQNWATELLD